MNQVPLDFGLGLELRLKVLHLGLHLGQPVPRVLQLLELLQVASALVAKSVQLLRAHLNHELKACNEECVRSSPAPDGFS